MLGDRPAEVEELNESEQEALRARIASIPVFRTLGFANFQLGRGLVRCTVPWCREFDGIFESFHGGLLMTAADSAAAVAVLAATGPQERIATADMSIRFLAPVRSEAILTAKVLKVGRTLVPVQANIEDARGRLAAIAQVTYVRLLAEGKP